MLVLAAADAIGLGHPDARMLALPAACALEMIHTYSLVHDDLPAMDNDTLRRGRPTAHVVYGDALAILSGDGLLTEAFALLAREPALDGAAIAQRKLQTLELIARSAGVWGMVGGQVLDLQWEGAPRQEHPDDDLRRLQDVHARKTGALIRAATGAGAIMAGGTPDQIAAVDAYATELGLCFQIVDDVLDVEGDAASLGKHAGKDEAAGKLTYPALFGVDGSRQRARDCAERGHAALEAAGLVGPPAGDPRLDPDPPPVTETRPSRVRLDALLVQRGLASSRERARALILAGHVSLPGTSAPPKPGHLVREDADVQVRQADHPYVGRGALKLVHALDTFAHPGRGARRARHRRLDRRLHRRAAAAGRGACRRPRRRAQPDGLAVAVRSTRQLPRTHQRAAPHGRRPAGRPSSSSTSSPPTCRSSRCGTFSRSCRRSCGRAPTSSRWSSRSSRPGARKSASMAWFATRPCGPACLPRSSRRLMPWASTPGATPPSPIEGMEGNLEWLAHFRSRA